MDILDYNPLTGETVTFQYNHSDDTFTIGHQQDVEPLLDANKREVIESNASRQMKNDWIKYASVPNILIMKWKRELNVDFFKREDWPKVMSLINSRDYGYVKTTTIYHDR